MYMIIYEISKSLNTSFFIYNHGRNKKRRNTGKIKTTTFNF